jgi:hypothetical protein
MHVENKRKYRTENRAKNSLLDEESMHGFPIKRSELITG